MRSNRHRLYEENNMMSRFCVLFTACLLLAAGPVGAQQVYKSTMPDGKVIYGPEPEPGAKKVDKVTTKTQDAGVRISTPEQKRNLEQREAQQQAQSTRREAELSDLKRALQEAEAAREAGREPHDGDFIGNAGGGMRLTDAYLERQKTLEAAVQDARKRLEAAQRAPQ
jgi:hypothetical protein